MVNSCHSFSTLTPLAGMRRKCNLFGSSVWKCSISFCKNHTYSCCFRGPATCPQYGTLEPRSPSLRTCRRDEKRSHWLVRRSLPYSGASHQQSYCLLDMTRYQIATEIFSTVSRWGGAEILERKWESYFLGHVSDHQLPVNFCRYIRNLTDIYTL